jgi:heme A synthase
MACYAVCTPTVKSTNKMEDNLRILSFVGGLWGGVFLVWALYAVYQISRHKKTRGLAYAVVAALFAWQLLPALRLFATHTPLAILLGSSISVAALFLLKRRDTLNVRN